MAWFRDLKKVIASECVFKVGRLFTIRHGFGVNLAFKHSDEGVLVVTSGLLGETASEVGACLVPAWNGSEGKGREGSVEISI
jgi:hypothetical protein